MTVSEQSKALVPRNGFKEEASRPDNRVAVVDAPPRAPSPPPPPKSLPAPAVNVFDFLVTDGKDGHSAAATPKAEEEWDMSDDDNDDAWEDADDVFMDLPPDYDEVEEQMYNARRQLEADELAYRRDPAVPPVPNPMAYFVGIDNDIRTPTVDSKSHSRNISTDSTTKKSGKRKRSQPEDLDLSRLRGYATSSDVIMTDAAPALHSGLTGGMQKMLMARPGFPFPPSPDDSNGDGDGTEPVPPSPLKRSRRAKHEKAERGRSRAAKDAPKPDRDPKKTRRPSDEPRRPGRWERRRRRADSPSHDKDKDKEKEPADAPKTLLGKALKAIEYPGASSSAAGAAKKDEPATALMLHPSRAAAASPATLFVRAAEAAAVPAADRGCSVHKALRRFHRERGDRAARAADEKDLWRDLRLRVNDAGELVLFVG